MPKLKTHKGAAKRFKKTGDGQSGSPPCLRAPHSDLEARKRKRKLHQGVVADPSDQPSLQQMIPY